MSGEVDMLPESERELGTVLFLRAHETGREEDLGALENWLGDDPVRRDLIAGLAGVWQGIGDLRDEIAAADPVRVAANDDMSAIAPFAGRARNYGALAAGIALALMVGIALLIGAPWQASEHKRFATAIGEHKEVVLADGTQILLDAASSLTVEYKSDERLVRLVAGQAYFDVAHDADRPFHVEAAGHDVQALGTEFNVAVNGSASSVSLVEGSVLVSELKEGESLFGLQRRTSRKPVVTLKPGEAFENDRRGDAVVHRFDLAAVSAWQKRRIVFEDLPLRDAVAIVNHYSQRAVTLGPGLPDARMTGVFNAGDGMAFAETVVTYLPQAQVEASNDSILIRVGD